MSGLYIHIPFCKQACSYCDFHFSTNLSIKNEVVLNIIKEIELRHNYFKNKKLSTIYFGGGTPSLLNKSEFEAIFTAINKFFVYDSSIEITIETNPDDISAENLNLWKSIGINRLSIGLQSFNDEELKWMNRAHTAKDSVNSVLLAQEKGFNNITIDLIYGSKFQDLKTWENTLIQAVSLNTQHISSYNLTIENKTALGVNNLKGKEPSVSDDLSSQQFLLMTDFLKQSDFIHYEISNFGKAGFFAKHNSNYWLQKHYLGIGPSAHSFNGVSRQWNLKNNGLYSKAIENKTDFFEKEELSIKDRFNEYVLTRLRTIWGCDTEEIKLLFGETTLLHFLKIAEQKKADFEINNATYTLTNQARLYADGIAADFFLE
ncbi:MAG: radical SAM family heme chaperone HemW [Bacteroidota bacterium]|nr:radical SAM family heme chaperone HemW [Bacteroidota bacterium]MDP3146217.1 radical SAM family heme chaperone HemW [Bacteroidota bacterium]MDP3556630.1 radical SAM family heme chaperone HemW [Bacteroidota bacterium]